MAQVIIHYPTPSLQLKPPQKKGAFVARKSCFGDDNYFNETSRGCIRCPHFNDCKDTVNKKAYRGWGPSTSTTSVRRVLPGTMKSTASSSSGAPAVVRSIARESTYNFEQPIMPQLARYMGFSVAEVALEELLTLVNQSRASYVEQINSPITIEVTEDGNSTIKVDKKG